MYQGKVLITDRSNDFVLNGRLSFRQGVRMSARRGGRPPGTSGGGEGMLGGGLFFNHGGRAGPPGGAPTAVHFSPDEGHVRERRVTAHCREHKIVQRYGC